MKTQKEKHSGRLYPIHVVPNNKEADKFLAPIESSDERKEREIKKRTLYDARLINVIEAYRRSYGYRRTASGNLVDRGEPDEAEQLRQSDQIQKNAQKRRAAAALSRLKQKKDGVPKKDGREIWEQHQEIAEDFQHFIPKFRTLYQSGKLMRFRDWINVVDDLMDFLKK